MNTMRLSSLSTLFVVIAVIAAGLVLPGTVSANTSTNDSVCSHLPSIYGLDGWVERCWNGETIEAQIPATGGGLRLITPDPVCNYLPSWVERCSGQ